MARASTEKSNTPIVLWAQDRYDEDHQAPLLISLHNGNIQIEATCASMLTLTKGDFEALARDVLSLIEGE